ncbi:hypothetical protein [Pseudomonas phage Ppu-503]|nr:hypothetical protein [Pseudomonas phage Ppu-503]
MSDTPNNYTLGRGELYLAQFKPKTQLPRGERYFGNTPELGFSADQETLDHYNSDRGIRVKDKSVVLQMDYAGSFITDNISAQNLAYFFLGEASKVTTTAATAQAETLGGTDGIELGLYYQLGTTKDTPTGLRALENLVFTSTGHADAVEGQDFAFEPELGRVMFIGGKFKDGDKPAVTYDTTAVQREIVITKGKSVEGAMRYIARNPDEAGNNIDYFMPWVKITPNGDFALKGDDWQQLSFNIEILKKPGMEAIYADGRPYTPDAP